MISFSMFGIIFLSIILSVLVGVILLAVFIISYTSKSKKTKIQNSAPRKPANPIQQEAQEPEKSKTLGETLKMYRETSNMTQEFVAESLGVSRQAVSKWENDTSDPSTSNLLAIAKLFGVSAAELLKNVE
ncbi:MAG: helix-turn-helix transcriptional regulator [Clostridia bacterium]|nr:helix-turn-helix transcriptional regulator [Clostridia bacterium]